MAPLSLGGRESPRDGRAEDEFEEGDEDDSTKDTEYGTLNTEDRSLTRDHPHHLPRQGETKGAGHKGGGSEAGSAVEAEAGVGSGFTFRGAGAVGLRVEGFFGGEDAGDTPVHGAAFGAFREAVLLAQAASHLLEQGIGPGLTQVRHAHLGRVAPAACTARDDDRQPESAGFGENEGFDRRAVHGIHDTVEPGGEEAVGAAFQKEFRQRQDLALRVDLAHPLGQHTDLCLPHCVSQGGELAVGVGDADVIHVDQRQVADATASQGLHHPGADAADTDDGDPGGVQAGQGSGAVEAGDAAEALEVTFGHGPDMRGNEA